MTAVTFALQAESSDFVRSLGKRAGGARPGGQVIHGEIRSRPMAILHTGVGAKVARERVESFLKNERIDYLISAGFAGALDPQLEVGDLVIAENFSSRELLQSPNLQLGALPVYAGKLITAQVMIENASERAALAAETGAIAVDMETETVAAVCAARGVPLLSIRAISDTDAATFPVPAAVLFDVETQMTNLARLAFYLAIHPARIARLIAFSKQIAIARESLTAALDAILRYDLR
ncbi:MAG: hypothetical protein ABI944_00550 [Chthoniobacterales bacterium]